MDVRKVLLNEQAAREGVEQVRSTKRQTALELKLLLQQYPTIMGSILSSTVLYIQLLTQAACEIHGTCSAVICES